MSGSRPYAAGVAIAAVLAAGVAMAATRQHDSAEPAGRASHSWECLMMPTFGFNQGTPVGMATYLLDRQLTRRGYPERAQTYYLDVLDELRKRDPREPLGADDPFASACNELAGTDLDPLPSEFDDDLAAEAIVRQADGRFAEVPLTDIVSDLLLRPDHGRSVYARVEGTTAMVVVDKPSGEWGAYLFDDPGKDRPWIESNSEGLRNPAYTSSDGSAVAGVAFFARTGFVFAHTTEPGAVQASLASDGIFLPLIEVHEGVADLTDAWGIVLDCGKSFTISWTDDNGAPVDELTDEFYCSPVD